MRTHRTYILPLRARNKSCAVTSLKLDDDDDMMMAMIMIMMMKTVFTIY
jgi:hypothetical protein